MAHKSVRTLVTIVLTILVFSVSLMGLNFVVDVVNSGNPLFSVQQSSLEMRVTDYTVYALPDVNFRFVLVDVVFEDDQEQGIEVDLKNFRTVDGVRLSETQAWIDQLAAKGYDFQAFKQESILRTSDERLETQLFVPLNRLADKAASISVEYPLINNINLRIADEVTEYDKSDNLVIDDKQMSLGNFYANVRRTGDAIYRVQRADREKLEQRDANGNWHKVSLEPHQRVVVMGLKAVEGTSISFSNATLVLTFLEEELFPALNGSYRLTNAQNIFDPQGPKDQGFMIFLLPYENAYERVTQGYGVRFE